MFSFFLHFFTNFFHLVVWQERILDDELLADAINVFVVARSHSSDWVYLGELEESNAHCSTDILKDIYGVVGSSHILVYLRVSISRYVF